MPQEGSLLVTSPDLSFTLELLREDSVKAPSSFHIVLSAGHLTFAILLWTLSYVSSMANTYFLFLFIY